MISSSLYADNLIQVYHQAVVSDPTFQKARADWLSAKQEFPLALSGTGAPGSGLFPNVDISGGLSRTFQRIKAKSIIVGPQTASGYFNSNNYLVTLTQPIFNYATWKAISGARFTVKAATATYLAAAQNLMFRTAQAYFNVLDAYDQLQYTMAQKESFLHQLVTAEEKFKVGLIAVTGVYDAQASYDQSVAQEIEDRNDLDNQLENLRAITGRYYKTLAGLKKTIPLVIPRPHNIDAWTRIAERQSYSIQSALNSMLAQRELVKQTSAGRYPTIAGVVTYGTQLQGFPPSISGPSETVSEGFVNTTTTTATAALNLNFPVFQGGFVINSTRQQEYNYLSASEQLNLTHRTVVNDTRQAYLGVDSGINKIKADRQAILSAQNKLEATQAGYVVGTRTMVDVLNAVTDLYQSQQQWATDRYTYIINIITLKQQAGTLSPKDLAQINTWLGKPVKFDAKKSVKVSKYAKIPPATKNLKEAIPPKGGQPTRRFHGPLVKPLGYHHHSKPLKSSKTKLSKMSNLQFAVQVFASHKVADANSFKETQPDKNKLHIVHQHDWYKVLFGDYATRQAAIKALKHLPASLKKAKPWVVSVPVAEHSSIPAKKLTILKQNSQLPALPTPR